MQDIWKRRGLFLLLGLWAALAGCGSEPSTGSAQLVALVQGAVGAEAITQVTVTVTAPDMVALSGALTKRADGSWNGTIASIPVGSERHFAAQAFDAMGVKRFEGQAQDVTITRAQPAAVALTLQPVTKPPPFDNSVPSINSVTASASTVAPGGTVQLTASVTDEPGDTLTHAWSAQGGTFSTPTKTSTAWTAPETEGPVLFTLTVTDSHGASASLSFTLTVASTQGNAVLTASFNTWPQVLNIAASRTQVDVNEPTELTATVAESDGDPLSYQWSAGCPGAWTNATSTTATFIPEEHPLSTDTSCDRCTVTVTVTDGRGGVAQGTLRLCVGRPSAPRFHPEIISTSPAGATVPAMPTMTFRVKARDGQDSPLSFAWAAGTGTLGTVTHGAGSSEVPWTAPSCLGWGQQPRIGVTVTNGLGLTASTQFILTGLVDCGTLGWNLVQPMSSSRMAHTTTRLQDGRVLVVGGYTTDPPAATALATAAIYDPATSTWQPTGSMTTARRHHTATLLPDGRVLVTGGLLDTQSTTNSYASAELYDPKTGSWNAAASMLMARDSHFAFLLSTGRVLVLGGEQRLNGSQTKLVSAELYDVTSNQWSATGSLAEPRFIAAASLLPSGQVLVTGGMGFTTGLSATAELYTPASGTWAATGAMAVSRRGHTQTTLLDGRVLVTGGYGPSSSPRPLAAEVFDPASGLWGRAGNLAIDRFDHAATVLPSGRVIVVGGFSYNNTSGDSYLNTAEIFDPALGTWTRTANMRVPRQGPTATLLPTGKVLVLGGAYYSLLNSAEQYTE